MRPSLGRHNAPPGKPPEQKTPLVPGHAGMRDPWHRAIVQLILDLEILNQQPHARSKDNPPLGRQLGPVGSGVCKRSHVGDVAGMKGRCNGEIQWSALLRRTARKSRGPTPPSSFKPLRFQPNPRASTR